MEPIRLSAADSKELLTSIERMNGKSQERLALKLFRLIRDNTRHDLSNPENLDFLMHDCYRFAEKYE